MKDSVVEVSKDEYIDLLLAEAKLRALENAGVDDWEWYEDAMDEFRESKEEIELEARSF